MASRYFTQIPNRFTGAALTAPADATQTTTLTNLFGVTAPADPVNGVWALATERTVNTTTGFTAGTPIVIWNRNIQFNSTGPAEANGGALVCQALSTVFGVHVWFVNCNIQLNYTNTSVPNGQWWPFAFYQGGTAPFRAAATGTTISVNGGQTVANNSNSFSFWGCTITNTSGAAGACLDVRFSVTDLIHTDIINNTFANTNAGVFEPVICSSGQVYGSTFNGANSLQPSNFHNEGYGIAYSPTLLNGLSTSAGLALGLPPITYVASSPAAYGNNQSGILGGTLQVHDYIFTGVSKTDRLNTTAVTAAGTQVMTNKSLAHMEANQVAWWTSLTFQDPITQPTITQAAGDTPQNWFETRFSIARGAYRYIASSTVSPYAYTNLLNPTGSPTANVKLRATYGSSFGTAGTITTITNTAPASPTIYTTASTGRISTTAAYDPYDGNTSTALATTGLRTPYAIFTPNANPANNANIAVYSTTQPVSNFDMRAAGRLINNGTGAYTFTVNTANASANLTGLPLISNVPAPVRPEAATAFVTAASTSDAAMDTYFGTVSGKSLLTNGWNTQDFGDYVDYRWSAYDTNANPVSYNNSYLNLGSQNVTIDNNGTTGFNTASQTWTLRSNVLAFSTANGGASLGGITTTGTVRLNSAYNVPGTYAPIVGGAFTYNANGTILQSIQALGQNGVPASWRTNSTLGAGTGTYSFTATLPAGLGASSVTATGVAITGTAATDIPVIQNAMDAALDAAGVSDISINITVGTGTPAVITYSGTYTLFNSSYGSTATFNVPNAAGTGNAACTITANGSWATQASGMQNIVTALNGNSTFTGAGWTASTTGTTVVMTRTTSGPLTYTTVSVSGQDSNWAFNMPTASWGIALVNGAVGGNVMRATFTAAVPAVGGVAPTSALTFLSSPNTYITGTVAGGADMLQSSVAGNAGTIAYPTTGTVINTNGTIIGLGGTTTATGPITVQGGFRQGSYTGTSTNPLNFALTTSGSFTLRGANTLDSGLTISGGSSGLITLGETTDTAASRTTYGANTSRQHDVEITGSTSGGTVTVNSGLMAGGTTQCGLTIIGYNVNLGSGLDTSGSAKLSVAGQTTARGNIVTINGMRTATANLSTIAFEAEARTAGNLGGVITATDLNIGGTGVKNFLLNTATNPGSMTFTRCDFGGSPTFITLRNSGGSIALNNCTTTAVIRNGDTTGTLGVAGGSTLTGGIDSLNLTTLLVTGGSTVGLLALPAINNVTLGNAAGTAILTNGGSALNAAKNTVYAIDNLDLTGNLTIAQAPATAFKMTPTINMRTGSTLTIDCGSSNNLTIDASKITFANAGATFARAAGASGTIALLNWPAGKAVPTGFTANVTTAVTLSLTDTPATAPTIRVAEAYKNAGSTNVLAGITPTYANGVFTWTFTSSASDTINGAIFLVDGYQIARGTSANATVLSATAVPETNVDFGQTLGTADTAFIATTSWSSANAFLATNPYVSMTTSSTVTYTTTPTTRTAVELGKIVMRRTLETTDANTVEMRRAMAFGTLATSFISFTQTGLSVNQVAGLATSGVGLKINKVANAASQNAVITWAIWAVDNLGDFYNLNTANGRNPTTPTTLILWEGFSPGAVANLTTGQINQIGTGVSNVLTGSTGPLTLIARGVEDASLVVPTTINL